MNGFMKSLLFGCIAASLAIPGAVPGAATAFAATAATEDTVDTVAFTAEEAAGDATVVTIGKSWVALRAAPASKAKALGIVFGNDTFRIVRRKNGWAQVKLQGNNTAWITESAFLPDSSPATPPARTSALNLSPASTPPQGASPLNDGSGAESPARTLLSQAIGQQVAGLRMEAREGYLQILLRYPGTREFYEAVRQMNYYYPLGDFPPVPPGGVAPMAMDRANGKLGQLLIAEGEALLGEERHFEAAAVFEMALLNGGAMWQRAETGMHEALTSYMEAGGDASDANPYLLAQETFRHYFPHQEIPESLDD